MGKVTELKTVEEKEATKEGAPQPSRLDDWRPVGEKLGDAISARVDPAYRAPPRTRGWTQRTVGASVGSGSGATYR